MTLNIKAEMARDSIANAHVFRVPEIAQILSTILLGLVLLFGIGFAQARFAHDAAHDSRHSVSFPCH